MKNPCVYILASQRNGTLYIGVTSDLIKRIWEHREGMAEGFTKQYGVKILVWYEQHDTMETAISREKAMKKWRRDWKLKTIEEFNPNWLDLWPQINGQAPITVVPAHAGTQRGLGNHLDSRIRGNDAREGAEVLERIRELL